MLWNTVLGFSVDLEWLGVFSSKWPKEIPSAKKWETGRALYHWSSARLFHDAFYRNL